MGRIKVETVLFVLIFFLSLLTKILRGRIKDEQFDRFFLKHSNAKKIRAEAASSGGQFYA